MNYFFFTHAEIYQSKLTIPKYQNFGQKHDKICLFGARALYDGWDFYQPKCEENEFFFHVYSNSENAHDVFFLCEEDDFRHQVTQGHLVELNEFTNTSPAFRANLCVSHGRFQSSYQSEYPLAMARRDGFVMNVASLLFDEEAVRGTLSLRNISASGAGIEREVVFFDLEDEKELSRLPLMTNSTNLINLEFIRGYQAIGFIANLMAIPVFCLEYASGSLSFEHTHPPHEHVGPSSAFQVVKKKREELVEKFFKKSFTK